MLRYVVEGRGTYEDGDKLKAVGLITSLADADLVAYDESDFNDASDTSGHESVAKHGVRRGADHQLLGVGRHTPAGHHDDETRDEIALGRAVSVLAEPDTRQAGAPPDDTHGGVLPVVLDPRSAPSVLRKGVDTSPGSDDNAVEELLAPAGSLQPHLADDQQDREEDAVRDEGAAHDEMGRALADVFALAEAERRDATEQHLRPREHGEDLSVNAVEEADGRTDLAVEALLQVQPEIDAQHDLGKHDEEERGPELGVDVGVDEFAAAVHVAEDISEDGDGGCQNLDGNMPSRFDHLRKERKGSVYPRSSVRLLPWEHIDFKTHPQNHPDGEQDAKGEHLYEDMGP